MPIEAAEAVVGTMRVSNTTLRTLRQRLPCSQMEGDVHESAIDVMGESSALRRMNGLLLVHLS